MPKPQQRPRAYALLRSRKRVSLAASALAMGLLAACGSDNDGPPAQEEEIAGCDGTVTFAETEGTFASGTPWNMRRPTKWNGVLINDLDYVGAKDSARSCYWLMNGYALSGTARNPQRTYNYDPAREQDELMQLIDMFAERYGKPKTVVQYGHSGGGFDALNIAERFGDRVDGVVAGCAHEQVPLMNMMMDGWFVLKTLIAPELKIVGFDDLDTVSEQSAKWKEALSAAQETPEGRARIALAAAIGQWPAWGTTSVPKPDPEDKAALQEAIFETVLFNAGQPGGQSRFMSEHAGGSPVPRQLSWNKGIHYEDFLGNAEPMLGALVQALYADAGLDMKEDLDKLATAERIEADPEAIAFWAAPGRTVHGTPTIPVLRFHTTGDSIVPPTIMDAYVQKMEANGGNTALYRTTVVDRPGHCTFDPSESAAAVDALLSRINTGIWPDLSPDAMNARAKELIPASEPLFVPFESPRANRPDNAPPEAM